MYLVSAYFDEETNKILNSYISKIAEVTGNTFMTKNQVPPHITISSIEARSEEILLESIRKTEEKLMAGNIDIVSVGAFFPYVMYATPVLNTYLQNLSQIVYDGVKMLPETKVSRFYTPMNWFPHITLGKTLDKEQMRVAFQVMQERFAPVKAKIIKIGLSKTNPYRDVYKIEFKERG